MTIAVDSVETSLSLIKYDLLPLSIDKYRILPADFKVVGFIFQLKCSPDHYISKLRDRNTAIIFGYRKHYQIYIEVKLLIVRCWKNMFVKINIPKYLFMVEIDMDVRWILINQRGSLPTRRREKLNILMSISHSPSRYDMWGSMR